MLPMSFNAIYFLFPLNVLHGDYAIGLSICFLVFSAANAYLHIYILHSFSYSFRHPYGKSVLLLVIACKFSFVVTISIAFAV